MNGATRSGIGRRRGAAASSKSPLTSIVVVAVSFSLTFFVILILGFSSSAMPTIHSDDHWKDAPDVPLSIAAEKGDAVDELMSKQFRKWAEIIRGDLHLVNIETSGIISNDESKKKNKSGASYQGVKAIFCKLDWAEYKKDPPLLPMFRMLVSASGCDKTKNLITMDLVTVVQKTRGYDKIREMRQTQNVDGVHVMPPAGFVFHESRVGSTLVANALTAMNPEGHRVYSESTPINEALKACQGMLSKCDMDVNVELFRDVVYLMGRTSSPTEKNMFFKVSSVGSKRIGVLREAFPSVPWIFVYRDPVQTMMSHLDPAKIQKKNVRGGAPAAVCTRAKRHPPEDLIQLANDYGEDVDELSDEEFCAAHLATLCESALRQMKKSDGKGVAVEYDGLVDKLIQSIIPNHFGIDIDEAARQRILDVAKVYSKSKTDKKDWVEDSRKKDKRSTPEIRAASTTFLSAS
eukprot:CAMPEP_0172298702 /NCGR_PEP_ID=MMETSP1058-20130122/1234_1 /TAXON_ID=83371 /ORGANISM="Detonula confervacea, Strain CCMP 353" /LENGTH=461 /DNA_ID=CAMNT_0013007989 /DNA_START=73 /DNA_END=1455 /DNA_ORIENTATION=-